MTSIETAGARPFALAPSGPRAPKQQAAEASISETTHDVAFRIDGRGLGRSGTQRAGLQRRQ